MKDTIYEVLVDDHIIAKCLPLNYALILVKGVFYEYYNDTSMQITIRPMRDFEEGDYEC